MGEFKQSETRKGMDNGNLLALMPWPHLLGVSHLQKYDLHDASEPLNLVLIVTWKVADFRKE